MKLVVYMKENAIEELLAFLGYGIKLFIEEITSDFLPGLKLKLLIFLIQADYSCKHVL